MYWCATGVNDLKKLNGYSEMMDRTDCLKIRIQTFSVIKR